MESVWDYPRPPRLELGTARITVVHAGVAVADSERCRRVLETSHPPVFYVPRDDVAPGVPVAGRGRSLCEYTREAGYCDVHGGWITDAITGPFKGPPGTNGW
jgi:uncharacterized protein (DUF427 family)